MILKGVNITLKQTRSDLISVVKKLNKYIYRKDSQFDNLND